MRISVDQRSIRCLALPALLTCFSCCAIAQEIIPDFYKGPGIDVNRSYVNQNFNELIDPFNGSLQLHYVDINIPGNGGFDLQIARSYNSAAVDESNPGAFFGSAGVGWTLHFGRVLYKASVGACGGKLWPDVLKSPILELPDGSTQILAVSAIPGASLLSTRRWRAECTSGMAVYSPDGVRYDMDQAVSVPNGTSSPSGAFYTTKITDRNGNFATIAYAQAGSPEVTTVATSDGRRVEFAYHPLASNESTRRISKITSIDAQGNRSYTYDYTAVGGVYGGYQLTSVTRPDGTKWQYRYLGNLNANVPGGFQLNGVTYPEGGTIAYSYGSSSSDYVFFDSVSNTQSRTTVVKSKMTSDGGNWSFAYLPGGSGVYDTTTVNTPSGKLTYRHVGPNYATAGSLWMVGLLMQKQIGDVQTETYGWAPQVISSQQMKRPGAWMATRLDQNTSAPALTSKVIVRDGATHTTSYGDFDVHGNPTSMSESGPNGGNRTTTLSYFQNAAIWLVRQIRDQKVSGGRQISRTFDNNGNMLNMTQDGVTTAYAYLSDGSISQATFPRGLVHSYSNYKRGIAQAENQPEGIGISRTVSDSGNVLSETNARNYTTRYGHDGLNRLTKIEPTLGSPTSIDHGPAAKSATRGPLKETTQYDGFGRPASVTLGGIVRTYKHDSLGRVVFVSNPGDAIGTEYRYDMLDRLSGVSNADGSNRVISFSAAGKTVQDERGFSTTYAYRAYGDPAEQFLMSVTAPDASANLALDRDSKDLVTSVGQGGYARGYGYDSRGFLTAVNNPETGTTIYGRDDANNMVSKAVGSSGATSYDYDGQNRLVSVTYSGATPAVVKTYTPTGKLASVSSSSAQRLFDYDANENLTGETLVVDQAHLTLTYAYNGLDQLSALTYPVSNRVVSLEPDPLGRPSRVGAFAPGVAYWPSGQIRQISYANGTTSSYGQNSRLWPSAFQTLNGAYPYLSNDFSYDGVGNLVAVTDAVDPNFSRQLSYDALNRLISADGPWGSGSLRYDGAGNLRSQSFGPASISYSYNSGNQLSGVEGLRLATYSYDSHGNVVGNGSQTFGYDDAPNMVCANCGDEGARVAYQYDGLNRRVSAVSGQSKTYEFYSFNGDLLTEFTPQSNLLVEHVYLGGKRIATLSASAAASLEIDASFALLGKGLDDLSASSWSRCDMPTAFRRPPESLSLLLPGCSAGWLGGN